MASPRELSGGMRSGSPTFAVASGVDPKLGTEAINQTGVCTSRGHTANTSCRGQPPVLSGQSAGDMRASVHIASREWSRWMEMLPPLQTEAFNRAAALAHHKREWSCFFWVHWDDNSKMLLQCRHENCILSPKTTLEIVGEDGLKPTCRGTLIEDDAPCGCKDKFGKPVSYRCTTCFLLRKDPGYGRTLEQVMELAPPRDGVKSPTHTPDAECSGKDIAHRKVTGRAHECKSRKCVLKDGHKGSRVFMSAPAESGRKGLLIWKTCRRVSEFIPSPQVVLHNFGDQKPAGVLACADCGGLHWRCCRHANPMTVQYSRRRRKIVCDECNFCFNTALNGYFPMDADWKADTACQCTVKFVGASHGTQTVEDERKKGGKKGGGDGRRPKKSLPKLKKPASVRRAERAKTPVVVKAVPNLFGCRLLRKVECAAPAMAEVLEQGGWVQHRNGRKVKLFGGCPYRYSKTILKNHKKPANLVQFEKTLMETLRRKFPDDGINERWFASCLINWYPPGVGIPNHSDDEDEIDQSCGITTYTMGSSATFELRDCLNDILKTVVVEDGTVLIMPPFFQYDHEHKVRPDNTGVRISFTWRAIEDEAEGCVFDEADESSPGPNAECAGESTSIPSMDAEAGGSVEEVETGDDNAPTPGQPPVGSGCDRSAVIVGEDHGEGGLDTAEPVNIDQARDRSDDAATVPLGAVVTGLRPDGDASGMDGQADDDAVPLVQPPRGMLWTGAYVAWAIVKWALFNLTGSPTNADDAAPSEGGALQAPSLPEIQASPEAASSANHPHSPEERDGETRRDCNISGGDGASGEPTRSSVPRNGHSVLTDEDQPRPTGPTSYPPPPTTGGLFGSPRAAAEEKVEGAPANRTKGDTPTLVSPKEPTRPDHSAQVGEDGPKDEKKKDLAEVIVDEGMKRECAALLIAGNGKPALPSNYKSRLADALKVEAMYSECNVLNANILRRKAIDWLAQWDIESLGVCSPEALHKCIGDVICEVMQDRTEALKLNDLFFKFNGLFRQVNGFLKHNNAFGCLIPGWMFVIMFALTFVVAYKTGLSVAFWAFPSYESVHISAVKKAIAYAQVALLEWLVVAFWVVISCCAGVATRVVYNRLGSKLFYSYTYYWELGCNCGPYQEGDEQHCMSVRGWYWKSNQRGVRVREMERVLLPCDKYGDLLTSITVESIPYFYTTKDGEKRETLVQPWRMECITGGENGDWKFRIRRHFHKRSWYRFTWFAVLLQIAILVLCVKTKPDLTWILDELYRQRTQYQLQRAIENCFTAGWWEFMEREFGGEKWLESFLGVTYEHHDGFEDTITWGWKVWFANYAFFSAVLSVVSLKRLLSTIRSLGSPN
nr:hypothetical protein [Oyosh tombus-like virus]